MAYFHFHQNNSGGRWDGPANVFVEADDWEEANFLAERKSHVDFTAPFCPCCGERWLPMSDYDKGAAVPAFYDSDDPAYALDGHVAEWSSWDRGRQAVVVHKNGLIEGFLEGEDKVWRKVGEATKAHELKAALALPE